MQSAEMIFTAVYRGEKTKKLARMGQKIMSLLKPRHQLLFLEYERQANLMYGGQVEKAYKIGRKEGRLVGCRKYAVPNKIPNKNILKKITMLK